VYYLATENIKPKAHDDTTKVCPPETVILTVNLNRKRLPSQKSGHPEPTLKLTLDIK